MSYQSCLMRKRPSRRAFTLIEMLVVITIIGVLAALILPALLRSQDIAKRTYCQNNLRNLGQAMRKYCVLYDGFFPTQDPWRPGRVYPLEDMARVMGILGENEELTDGRPAHAVHKVIQCPSCEIDPSYDDYMVRHYTVNAHLDSRVIEGAGDYETRVSIRRFPPGYSWTNPLCTGTYADFQPHKMDFVRQQSTVMIFMDSADEVLGGADDYWEKYEYYMCSQMAGGSSPTSGMRSNRHGNGCNMVFLDGHVEWKPYSFFLEENHQTRWLFDTDTGNTHAWWPNVFSN